MPRTRARRPAPVPPTPRRPIPRRIRRNGPSGSAPPADSEPKDRGEFPDPLAPAKAETPRVRPIARGGHRTPALARGTPRRKPVKLPATHCVAFRMLGDPRIVATVDRG